jgi:hypothetical protein
MKILKSNFNSSGNVPKNPQQISLQRLILLIFLLILIIIGVLPGYLQGGKWTWLDLANIDNKKQLNQIKETGIKIRGWQIQSHGQVQIGDKKWLIQEMVKEDQKFTLLLFPQTYYLNSPGVEWTDLNAININAIYCNSQLSDLMAANPERLGIQSESAQIREVVEKGMLSKNASENLLKKLPLSCQRNFQVIETNQQVAIISTQNSKDWKTDSHQKLTISFDSGKTVETLFLRGRNKQQTFAVLQWYAWESGGNFAPKNWFFTDLWAQLQKRRTPWIAVSVIIPMKILGNIETVRPLAESIVREVQTTIGQNILAP